MAKQLKTVSYSRRLNVVVFGACTQRTVTSSRSVDCLVYAFLFVLRPAHIPDVHYTIIHANISQIARVRGSASGVCVSLDTIVASYWKRTHPKCLLLGHSTLATFTFRHEYTNKLFRRIHRLICTKIAGKCCMLQASMPMNSINFHFEESYFWIHKFILKSTHIFFSTLPRPQVESVELALNMLDDYDVRGNKIKVQRAQFQMRGEYNPALKPKKKKQDKEKLKRMQEKFAHFHMTFFNFIKEFSY